LHSGFYFEKFRILEDPALLRLFSRDLSRFFRRFSPDRVAGPFTGGAILAYEVARIMGIRAAYAEKGENGRVFRRGFNLSGERVVVVDDVLTTGRSLTETVRAVEEAGGEVVAVGVMVKRGEYGGRYPFHSVLELNFPTYSPRECPLCASGLPITSPGKGGV